VIVPTCKEPRCFNPLPCPKHKQERVRQDVKTHEERRFYSSRRWTEASLRHRQHEPLCRLCKAEGRIVPAQQVDHIIPVREGVNPWDETNWQSLCAPCHLKKSRRDQGISERTVRPVTVVYGLSGTGKTTYVRERAKRGDLIVDLDYLFQALSGLSFRDNPECLLPFVASARDAVYERLQRPSEIGRAWIITTDRVAANGLRNRLKAEIIELEVEESVRAQRLASRATA